MRVLYVDDHGRFRGAMTTQFLSAHEVAFAALVAQAKALLATETFDVVLLDYDLPDGTGLDLVPELRARKLLSRTVAVSAFDEKNVLLLEVGVARAVPKRKFATIVDVLDELAGTPKVSR